MSQENVADIVLIIFNQFEFIFVENNKSIEKRIPMHKILNSGHI